MSGKAAKNGIGLLVDTARAEPVTVEKHGQLVAVMLAVEELQRLLERNHQKGSARQKPRATGMNK